MTKTKKNDRHGNSKHANSRAVAVTAARTAESNSAVSVSASPDREKGGPDQTMNQVSPEHSSDDFDMAVRELAYFKWEAAGFPEGDGLDFWLEAERQLHANHLPSNPVPE